MSDEFLLPNAIKRTQISWRIGHYFCAPPCPILLCGTWLSLESVTAAVDLRTRYLVIQLAISRLGRVSVALTFTAVLPT